jgi:hypothetical protein
MSRTVAGVGALALGAMIALAAPDAQANVVFSGTSGGLSASASFDLINSGTQLQITLTNSGTGTATDSSQLLSALFFDLGTTATLTPVSMTGTCLSGTQTACTPSVGKNPAKPTTLGDYWQYKTLTPSSQNYNADQGLGSAGLGIFGPNGDFGSNPQKVGGQDYSILPANYNLNNGTAKNPFIEMAATFVLDITSGTVDLSKITNVTFQYGTDLSDAHIPNTPTVSTVPVPIPAALPILTAALGGFGFAGWRQNHKSA